MKRKNISADTALLEVARRHNTTVDEVRKEIRIAMAVAMCSPDPDVQKRWRENSTWSPKSSRWKTLSA